MFRTILPIGVPVELLKLAELLLQSHLSEQRIDALLNVVLRRVCTGAGEQQNQNAYDPE